MGNEWWKWRALLSEQQKMEKGSTDNINPKKQKTKQNKKNKREDDEKRRFNENDLVWFERNEWP